MGKQGEATATDRGIEPIDDAGIGRLFDMHAASNGRPPRRADEKLRDAVLVIGFDSDGTAGVWMANVRSRTIATLVSNLDSPRGESGATPQVAFANLVQALESELRSRKQRAERDAEQLGALLGKPVA